MIRLLTGDNDFMIWQTIRLAKSNFDGGVEMVEGADLDLNGLADLLAGGGLFAQKKLVVIRELSRNKQIWPQLPNWLDRVDEDTELVLVEPKLDKRTATAKVLLKVAKHDEFKTWTERELAHAIKWTLDLASGQGLTLDRVLAEEVVHRSLVASGRPGQAIVDQWRISHTLDKLRAIDSLTLEDVRQAIEPEPRENSFELLSAALSGNMRLVRDRLEVFRQTEEPHMLYGLIAGQVFQLLAVAVADKPLVQVAKDLSVHPYALEKLQPHARRLGGGGALNVLGLVQAGDQRLKTGGAEPWRVLESVLFEIARTTTETAK